MLATSVQILAKPWAHYPEKRTLAAKVDLQRSIFSGFPIKGLRAFTIEENHGKIFRNDYIIRAKKGGTLSEKNQDFSVKRSC